MGQPCPLRWSLPRGRMSMCITQPMLFSPLCFGHLVLAPLSAYREACSPRHNEVVVLKECVVLRQDGDVSLSCLLPRRSPVLGYVLAEPRFTSCLLVIQGGHVSLSTMVETGVRRSRLISEPPGDTVLNEAPGLMSETSPVNSRKCMVAATNSMHSLTKTLSNCQEQLRPAEQILDERCEPLKEVPSEAPSLSHGDPQCWTDQFTSAMCCSPPPSEILEVGARSLPSNAVALLVRSIFMCCVVSDINWCVQWCSCQFCFC